MATPFSIALIASCEKERFAPFISIKSISPFLNLASLMSSILLILILALINLQARLRGDTFPITIGLQHLSISPEAKALIIISGPMPAASPIVKARTGLIFFNRDIGIFFEVS